MSDEIKQDELTRQDYIELVAGDATLNKETRGGMRWLLNSQIPADRQIGINKGRVPVVGPGETDDHLKGD